MHDTWNVCPQPLVHFDLGLPPGLVLSGSRQIEQAASWLGAAEVRSTLLFLSAASMRCSCVTCISRDRIRRGVCMSIMLPMRGGVDSTKVAMFLPS